MADYDPVEEAKRKLAEDEARREQMQVRAVDYAQRGLPTGNVSQGEPDPNTPGTGFFINQAGDNLGPTGTPSPQGAVGIQGQLHPDEERFWAANPLGAVKDPQTGALIGLGDRPAGVNPDMVTSGLGPPSVPFSQQTRVNEGLGPPAVSQSPSTARPTTVLNPNDFKNPIYQNRLSQLDAEISDANNRIRGASTQRLGKNQASQFETEHKRLKTLWSARSAIANQMHQDAHEGFQVAAKNLELERNTQHANSGAEIMQFMAGLPRDPAARQQAWMSELGKPDRVAWLEAIQHNPELNGIVKTSIQGQQTAAEQQAAIQQLAGGRTVTLSGGSAKTPSFKVQPSMDEAVAKQTQSQIAKDLVSGGITQQQFAQRNKVEGGTLKDGVFTPSEGGTHQRVTIGDHSFAVPNATYNRLNTAIPTAQPSATPMAWNADKEARYQEWLKKQQR